jgi:hypothetical protein
LHVGDAGDATPNRGHLREGEPRSLARRPAHSGFNGFLTGGLMKFFLIASLAVTTAIASGANPVSWWQTYQELYPSDPAKRQALDTCFTEDPQFDRIKAAARAACYRAMLPALAPGESSASMQRASAVGAPAVPNFVDLWHGAGQGHLPQNDVRFEQQNETYAHPRATSAALGTPAH